MFPEQRDLCRRTRAFPHRRCRPAGAAEHAVVPGAFDVVVVHRQEQHVGLLGPHCVPGGLYERNGAPRTAVRAVLQNATSARVLHTHHLHSLAPECNATPTDQRHAGDVDAGVFQ